ncbi:uncharacterized protein LOC141588413 [Silene latifolia]|uniref:uncharacterized protein LOC141588413 n=1 Tax=Silene latifolia TaxID=37657 RepID=UPI003D784D63
MKLIKACNNFIILLVEKYNGRFWYIVLFYGAPSVHMRASGFLDLEQWIDTCKLPFLIVGDFNQVDYQCDKLSASQQPIEGAEEFNLWKLRNELVDIPFKGPRFTWCNNRKGEKRVYERLDKAMGSKDWLSLFPDMGLKHYPIQISDHAPIEVDLNLTCMAGKRPFKLDAWALDFEECLEKKAEWNAKWDDFDRQLEHGINLACNGGGEEEYTRVNEELQAYTADAEKFWKQRAKIKWTVGGIPIQNSSLIG